MLFKVRIKSPNQGLVRLHRRIAAAGFQPLLSLAPSIFADECHCCICQTGTTTPCCPDATVPTILFATVTGCSCINGTYPLTWSPNGNGSSTGPGWKVTHITVPCGNTQTLSMSLWCDPDTNTWNFSFGCRFTSPFTEFGTFQSLQCSPFQAIVNVTQTNNVSSPCCLNQPLTITITP